MEAVVTGAVKTSDIPACSEKVDIWALGVTLYELLTGIDNLHLQPAYASDTPAAVPAGTFTLLNYSITGLLIAE